MREKVKYASLRKKAGSLLLLMLALSLLLSILLPVYATDPAPKKVRVGYMNHPGFIQQLRDGSFSGYGVEYLEDICDYTGWEVEFVYASWSKQLEMLDAGLLDLVPLAQYTPERGEEYLYTAQPVGILQVLLLTMPNAIGPEESIGEFCNGKTIGFLQRSQNISLLDEYARRTGFTYQTKKFDFQNNLENALRSGLVDIIVCEQMIDTTDFYVLDRFTSDAHYFITSKENTQLMDELNYYIGKMNAYDPSYQTRLHKKYFDSGITAYRPFFSDVELAFIKDCPPVTIALIQDKPGAFYNDKGDLCGVIPQLMERVSDICGIEFNYIFIPRDQYPIDYLLKHPDFLTTGVLASNPAFLRDDVLVSDVYYNVRSALVVHDDTPDNIDITRGAHTIGTTASFQAMQLYLASHYPNLKVEGFLSVEDGLTALAKKEIDFFVYTGNVLFQQLSNPRFADLTIIDDHFMDNPRATVAINTARNHQLLDIMTKCLNSIPESEISRIETEELLQSTYQYQQSDVIYRYRSTLLIASLSAVCVIALFLLILYIRAKRYNQDIALRAEYDMSTGLLNRLSFRNALQLHLEQNKGKLCALLIVDLDDLKLINDSYGTSAGDDAIKGIARVLRDQFHNGEPVGRLGGDEFAVFLGGLESKSILIPILARLQQVLSSISIAESAASLKCSIGITTCIAGEVQSEQLYRQSDEALQRVKENGKYGFAFYESPSNISLSTPAPVQTASGESETLLPLSPALFTADDDNFKKVLDSFPNVSIYIIHERTHQLLYFNRRFKTMCPHAELGMRCHDLKLGPCQNCVVDSMGQQQMGHAIYYNSSMGGEIEFTAAKLQWKGEIPAVVITAWPRNQKSSSGAHLSSLSNQDIFDYITGGLTRVGFIRMMEQMQQSGLDITDYSVLFINIKDFKAVNELAGSDGGDSLLRTVFACVVQSFLHPVIGGRAESDHFIFLVEKSLIDGAKLQDLLSFRWEYEEKKLFIQCRCGVYPIEDSQLDIYKMIDRAKLAKEHIVDDYVQPFSVYDSSMLEEYSERASAFLLFDSGIKNNEFVLYYQPVIDVKTEKIVAAEALVRRITADGTVVPPGKFIPILERTGYISMLDRFVATTVGQFLKGRLDAGLPVVPISFNLSQKDFYDSELMNLILNDMKSGKLPCGYALLELTESAYTLHEQKHEDYLKRLQELGAVILLDDFGTGYSSFGMFKNYYFDRVKLDMSFVRQLSRNENVRKVVRAIISMCHDLGVKVVAEGVETENELTILRGLNCDYVQGYYFSRPLSEKSFLQYLSDHM